MEKYHHYFRNAAMPLALAASLYVIFAHIWIGYFSFAQVDDFDVAVRVRRNIFALYPYLKEMYLYFSGRLSTFTTAWIAHSIVGDIYNVRYFVMLGIGIFIAALLVFLKSMHTKFSPVFFMDIAFLLFVLSPDAKSEALYWPFGNILYALPLSLYLLTLAYAFRIAPLRHEKKFLYALFIGCMLLGNFNEQLFLGFGLYIGTRIFFSIFGYSPIPAPAGKRLFIMASGMCAGFAVDAMAPGNYTRHDYYTKNIPQDIPAIISTSLQDMTHSILPVFLLALCYGLIRAYFFLTPHFRKTLNARAMAIYIIGTIVICFSLSFIIRYGYNSDESIDRGFFTPYVFGNCDIACEGKQMIAMIGRVLFAPQIVAILSGMLLSNWLSSMLTQKRMVHLAVLACSIAFMSLYAPLLSCRFEQMTRSFTLAEKQQNTVFAQFRAAENAAADNHPNAVLPAIKDYHTYLMVADISRDPKNWQNILFADYFGLKQVTIPKAK